MRQTKIDRIPLSCAEPCEGNPVASPQTSERRTECNGSGPSASASPVIDRLVARLARLGSPTASPAAQARTLATVIAAAKRIDPSACLGRESGYSRCVIHEDPAGWSLAAIVLRPGQSTPAHDHGGWGGAVTIQGIERDRRFAADMVGNSKLLGERDYPPGTGYIFSPDAVHQPVGADPDRPTVALHFLASAHDGRKQRRRETIAAVTNTL
jgi:predicted metal-dependent enzyme (double-stranded beta helix superfamily)